MTSIEMTRHNVLESKVSRNCNRLQEYLKYRAQEEMEGPRVACAAPSLLSLIPNLASSFTNTAPFASGTFIDAPSAFSVVSSACDKGVTSPFTAFAAATQAAVANQVAAQFGSPTATASQLNTTTTATATLSPTSLASPSSLLYNQLMCLPGILENIRPEILKASMTTTQFKPIPNSERVDLARWRVKEPSDWAMDDVAGWMLDVSKRHGIPCEDINMVKFATLKGMDLLKMTEKDFASCDPNYGSLFYKELLKLMNVSPDDNLIDDVLRKYNKNEEENLVSRELQKQLQQHQQMQNQIFAAHQLSQQLHQAQSFQNLANNICAALSPAVNGLSGLSAALSPTSPLVASQLTQPRLSPLSQDYLSCFQQIPSTSNAEYESDIDVKPCFSKMRDTGKVRKRAQHSKGNKLWEFIRDALKDPSTCPSVVRWEDPAEGVFRIVESEKLARLWGERKNNHKMTYEKLSRAMRTYYDKQILVPVPKTGAYPKKLVYKFGPLSHGWNKAATV